MAADSDDKHGAAENAMPTIDEKEALKINHKAMSAKPSSAPLGQPGSADPLLSNKTSAATLAPSASPEGHVVSNRSSAATLVASAHRLGSSKPSVATLSPSRQTQASKQAGASSGGDQSGKSVLNLDHKTRFRHFLRIFTYSSWKDRLVLLFAVLASICSGVTMPMMTIIFGRVFGSFTAYYHEANTGETTEDMFRQEIIQCVLYLVYIFIARLVLSYIAFFGFRMSSLRISAAIRLEYMRCLYEQPVSVLDLMPPGQTAAIITITASTLQFGISEKLSSFLQAVSLVTSALIISLLFNWRLALVTGSGLVLVISVYGVTTPVLVRIMNRVQNAEIKASTVANEIFSSIRMVSAFGAEKKMMKRYESWIQESRRRGMRMPPIVACQQAPVFFSIFATFALCFWYSLKMYMAGQIDSPQTLIIVLLSVMMMASSIGGITTPLSAAARAAGAAAIFFATIDAPRPVPGGLKDPDVSAGEDIVFSHVNFAFPGRPNVRILDDLSVRFPAGKTTALVGPSGSGKSTIVALVERWYEMDGDAALKPRVLWLRNGKICVGSHLLKQIDIKWWRSQIGLVQQEPALFNNSIYRNVEYGLVGTQWENASIEIKTKMVKEACQEAFAEEFILRLPDRYETVVGDAGIKLSGGQRQRLAIARAIVRQPKILILDEATSAIDVRGEQIVQAALDKVSENRTTIMIAHRLSTIQKADNIIVMRKGRVVEQGTHADLMAREGGAYRTLATTQQLAMSEDDDDDEDRSSLSEKTSEKKSIEPSSTERRAEHRTSGSTQMPDAPKERGLFGSFGMLLREQKGQSPWYFLLLIGAIGGGASAPVQAFLFANLVSLFQLLGNSSFLQPLSNFWCLMFVMLAVGVGICYFILGWAATTVSFNITHHYRKEYLRSILSKEVSFFDEAEHSIGAMTARLATDPSQLQQLLGMNMAFVVISVLSVIGCLTISFYFGWKLTLVTVCTTMPIILSAAFFRVRYERQFEKMNNKVFAESAKFATESIGAFRTVSSFTLEDAICRRYEYLLQTHIQKSLVKSSLSTLLFALSDSISLPCMAFILWYGGKLMAEHEYWPFQYVIVYIAVLQGGIGAGQWLSFGPNIAKATVAANRIIALRKNDHADGRLISLDIGDICDDDKGVKVEFRDVWFRYPTRDAPVLNGLHMTIEKGQFAAVVGPSGSGKTTVISLLERFYRPSSGRILYNGLDILDLCLDNYRKEISLVAQEPSLFEGSIKENVLMGVDESTTDEAVIQACRDAGIHDFISSLPDGYNTSVGNRGIALSGGQKQRISIARALIRHPRLLLLDEATSNLDSETEKAVQAVFERTRNARTMIVVAHRLATIQNADIIFVLGDGRVIEKGDHASLLKRKGVYYQMCLSQALDK